KHATVNIDGWQSNVFSKATGVKVRLAEGITDGVVPTQAVMTCVAGDMMRR
ncbi:unnamed protein product, partial [marine sediment metagenome]